MIWANGTRVCIADNNDGVFANKQKFTFHWTISNISGVCHTGTKHIDWLSQNVERHFVVMPKVSGWNEDKVEVPNRIW